MLQVLSFDICALAMLVILMFATEFGRTTYDAGSRRLFALLATTMLAAIFDISANIHNGQQTQVIVNYICSGMYHIFRCGSFYLYISYIIAITGTRHRMKNTVIRAGRFIPFLAIVLITVTTPFNKLFYYYGDDNMYIRSTLFNVIYVCSAVYAIYALCFIIKNIPIIGYKKSASLASCAVLSLIASLVQYDRPYIVVDILGFTTSLLFIVLFVDNPGDKIESVSRLMRYQAYVKDLKTAAYTSKPIDVIHINVRNHKRIEEMLSYSRYVELIRELAAKLSSINSSFKYQGSLYYLRNGGYRVVLGENNLARTYEMANLICEAFNGYVSIGEMDVAVESSVNITELPQDFTLIEEFLQFGPVAEEFENAGDITYTSDMLKDKSVKMRKNIEKLVEKGIVSGGFEVYYQPIYNTKTGKFTEAEALLRLIDEDRNLILPEVFIPVAEQNGSIMELGSIVIQEVCALLNSDEIKDTGLERISINLSVIQCLQKDLAEEIIKLLDRNGISHDRIMFEITESLATDNQKVFDSNILKLSEAGIAIALDDYGTGYSNITTLSTMPLDTVKFDKSFVNTEGNERLDTILLNSIEMVKSIDKSIVIEGVEDEALSKKFMNLGCDYIQGYCYSRALRRERFVEFLRENNIND